MICFLNRRKAIFVFVVDVKNGFWHILLDGESSKLTTFDTRWGRFLWVRMPFGIAPAPHRNKGTSRYRTVADGIIVFGVGDTEHAAL